ncbi:MAG TPA: serine/threonine-protein kinase, partial [Polyangiaceae bacterium]|nr:serine/threonine-protein kinase [Polyangiaceae bacterium]
AAHHLALGERVAIKMLLPDAIKIEGVVARFQREARAASRIQSEHVARVMDVGLLDSGDPYLVMEYVEGRDLAAELEARGPLPIVEAINYVLQGAVGVAEAHALGIVHRDLKPPNLFLAKLSNGRSLVKVLDFGIAKDAGDKSSKDLTSTFSALGSAAYMSPEQLRMAKSVDARSDVWALGVVLFELLTDTLPFDGESVTAIAAAIVADPPKSLRALRPDVPRALEAAVLGCLEKDRERRTPSLAAFADAIAPFGGRQAGGLASRIANALAHEEPAAEVSQPQAILAPLEVEVELATLPRAERLVPPGLTSTGIDPTATLLPRQGPPRRTWLIAAVILAFVSVGLIAFLLSRPTGDAALEPVASALPSSDKLASGPSPAPSASSKEIALNAAQPSASAASAAPPPTTTSRHWTPKRTAPNARPTAPSKPTKKPMVTDL